MPTASPKFAKTARTDKEGRVIYTRTGAKKGCDYVRRKDPSTGTMVFRKVAQKKKFRGGFSCKYGTTSHNSKQFIYAFLNEQKQIEVDGKSQGDVEKYERTLDNIVTLIDKLSTLVPSGESSCESQEIPINSDEQDIASEASPSDRGDDQLIQTSDAATSENTAEIEAVLAGLRERRSNSGLGTGARNGRISERRQQTLDILSGAIPPNNNSRQPQRPGLQAALNRL
jgi:hypothetical protein